MSNTYRWNGHKPYKGASANEIGETLESLRGGGMLSTEAVVRAAKSQKSCLHRCFDWNEGSAAHKYRLSQAGLLMRSIRIVHLTPEGDPEPRIMYLGMGKPKQGSGYVAAVEVADDAQMAEQALEDAIAQLSGWRKRWQHVQQLCGAVAMVDQALQIAKEVKKPKKRSAARSRSKRAG